jgi:hypothetical protein
MGIEMEMERIKNKDKDTNIAASPRKTNKYENWFRSLFFQQLQLESSEERKVHRI